MAFRRYSFVMALITIATCVSGCSTFQAQKERNALRVAVVEYAKPACIEAMSVLVELSRPFLPGGDVEYGGLLMRIKILEDAYRDPQWFAFPYDDCVELPKEVRKPFVELSRARQRDKNSEWYITGSYIWKHRDVLEDTPYPLMDDIYWPLLRIAYIRYLLTEEVGPERLFSLEMDFWEQQELLESGIENAQWFLKKRSL